jgi:23S rRNA (pseudouridine1915-N3)-methyltransferase
VKLRLVKIGRVAYPELATLVRMYEERLRPFAKVECVELKDDEAALRILERKTGGARLVLLDERGREFSSREFAGRLQAYADDPAIKELTLVVGGPLGLPPALREAADFTWSLSRATFTSDMAWLLCWEQVYRAFNILKGTGYHHD